MPAAQAFFVGGATRHEIEDVVHLIFSFALNTHRVLRVDMTHDKGGSTVSAAASDRIV